MMEADICFITVTEPIKTGREEDMWDGAMASLASLP